MRDVLSTRDIAEMTGWPLSFVQRLCKSGKLPAKDVSLGGKKARYAILRSEWEAFIQPDNTRVAPPKPERRRKRIDEHTSRRYG